MSKLQLAMATAILDRRVGVYTERTAGARLAMILLVPSWVLFIGIYLGQLEQLD